MYICIYIIYRTILLLDQEPPVFTYCPSDIVMDNLTSFDVTINWQQPTVTDNSGLAPSLSFNRQSGDNFTVPGSYEVLYNATDEAGNEATCSFRITLKSKYKELAHSKLSTRQICLYGREKYRVIKV